MSDALTQEAHELTELLVGRRVRIVRRHRGSEVLIEFADGTRLFVNGIDDAGLDFSVTKGLPTEGSD